MNIKQKIGVAIVSAIVGLVPVAAMAATPSFPGCTFPPDHAIWNLDNTAAVGCITDVAWKAAEAAQSHGTDLPVFKYPATVTDKYGITYTCEAFLVHGCVDATGTPEYDSYIRGLGKIMLSSGFSVTQFPMYAKLLQAVR